MSVKRAACLILLIACDSGRARHAPVATSEPVRAPADARLAPDADVADAAVIEAPAPPAYSCAADRGDAEPIAHMLLHGLAPAPCAELPAAERAAQERTLAPPIIASGAAPDIGSVSFAWGCTSGGDTPVVVSYSNVHDATGAELWAVRAGKARRLDSVASGPPDEYSSTANLVIGPSGDFDGDGAAESIIVASHHASAHGTTFGFRALIGGVLRKLPSDLVVRAASGDRDGVIRPLSFQTHVTTPCNAADNPNTLLDCELQPPAGFVRADTCGPWDWEKHPPEMFVLGAGTTFVALPAAAAAKITAATAAARKAL
jgi:hypothetical protein